MKTTIQMEFGPTRAIDNLLCFPCHSSYRNLRNHCRTISPTKPNPLNEMMWLLRFKAMAYGIEFISIIQTLLDFPVSLWNDSTVLKALCIQCGHGFWFRLFLLNYFHCRIQCLEFIFRCIQFSKWNGYFPRGAFKAERNSSMLPSSLSPNPKNKIDD